MSSLIGGEFWHDSRIIGEQRAGLPGIFLGGGQSCLYLICEYLKEKQIDRVLLPSYLCPAILNRFDRQGLSYEFYEINADFSVDAADLGHKVGCFEAVLAIDYFGLSLTGREQELFASLKEKGLVLIEDKVHTLDSRYFGNFAFNSFRKFVPYSGGLLFAEADVSHLVERMAGNSTYFNAVRDARKKKTDYVTNSAGSEEEYLNSFTRAEELYRVGAFMGDAAEKIAIERLDLNGICAKRRRNYQYLLSGLHGMERIRPIFQELKDRVPLGMPVYLDPGLRDRLRSYLLKQKIFLPVHWDLRDETRITSEKSKKMSSQILTLVIDQRYMEKDLDRIFDAIVRFFRVLDGL